MGYDTYWCRQLSGDCSIASFEQGLSDLLTVNTVDTLLQFSNLCQKCKASSSFQCLSADIFCWMMNCRDVHFGETIFSMEHQTGDCLLHVFYQIDDVTTFIHSCLFSKCQLVDRVYVWFIHPPPKYGTSLVSSDNLSPALHLSFFTVSPFICVKKKDWLIAVNVCWQNNSWQIYRSDDEPRRLVCQIWIPNRTDLFLRNTNQ